MDPDITLKLLLEAARDGDPDALIEHAEALADWLRHGGFAPTGLIPALRALPR